jgi:DNA-binding response OmpR family regulator
VQSVRWFLKPAQCFRDRVFGERVDKKRVLAVDDEKGILNFVRVSLDLFGYEVTTTTTGAEALQFARSEKFDIIILDIVMAPMDGLEVLLELRTFSQVPVIVFTALNSVAKKALELGANGSIAKPFLPKELAKIMEDVMAKGSKLCS